MRLDWICIIALAWATPVSADDASDEKAALAWIERTGQRMMAPEPAPDELAPLVAKLNGARVVGIGEVNHGTHEDQAFKAALIKQLVKAGAIDALALEANRAAGKAFDRYVRFGEGDPVDAVRSTSFFRIWKGDEFAGLLLWLRAWNVANPDKIVRIFGIDNQDAGRDAEIALAFLAKRDAILSAKLRSSFSTLIAEPGGKYPNPSAWIQASKPGELPAALAAATQLKNLFTSRKAEWGDDPDYAEAAHAANIAWQNLNQYELEVGVVDLDKLPPDYLARRDRFMAQNLKTLLKPAERAAFWAHDLHVAHEMPEHVVQKGFVNIGSEIEKMLGDNYRTVGFTYSKATVLTRRADSMAVDLNQRKDDEPISLSNDRVGDAGHALAKLPGDAWWFAVDGHPRDAAVDRWFAKPLWRGFTGATVNPDQFQPDYPGDKPEATDVGFDFLVWFRRMTPQHRWPSAPTK